MSSSPSFEFPVYVLVESATADAATGGFRVEGVIEIETVGRRCVAVFSDRALAVQFARARQQPALQVGEFDDPIDFGQFLQAHQQAGFTHVCVDPLGMLPLPVLIETVLASLASGSR